MQKNNTAGSISYVMLIMIFARVLSLVSVQIYMSFFGTESVEMNIYSYAISLPNIIFNCFGTALGTVVIPIYSGYIAQKDTLNAKKFGDNLITITTLLTLALILIGLLLSPIIPKFTAFKDNGYSFAVKAIMIMMPVMLFYGLNYIFQGILQSHGKYGWPAFVSVPSSLVVIAYVFLLGDKYGITGLLVATLVGLSLQALILIPPLFKTSYRFTPSLNFKDHDIIRAGKMSIPVLLGVSAYQINMFYNVTMMANFEGMVTLLTYVQNIVLYMVLAFVYSITAVIYPKLSAFAATGDMKEYKNTLGSILTTVMYLLIPMTVGLISVRGELLELITKWGKITDENVLVAAKLLAMYSIGILGIGLKEILDRAFYALKKTALPAINGFIIMAINIILSLVLIKFIGPYGIPLAYSVASLTGMVILMIMLRRNIGNFIENFWINLIKSVSASAIMLAAVLLINKFAAFSGDSILVRLINLAMPCVAGVIVYGIMLIIFKAPILKRIKK